MGQQDLSGLRIEKGKGGDVGSGGSRRYRWLLLLVPAIVAAVLLLRGRSVEVETVSVSRTYPTQEFSQLNASGYVVAQRQAEVAATVTGRLEWLGVEEGDRVRSGQVLARLENRDAAAAREQAAARLVASRSERQQVQAELHEATLSHGRQQELLQGGIVSRADFDAAEARFRRAQAAEAAAAAVIRQAEAALRAADVALDHTLIRAPFDGVVLTKNADVGDIVTPIGASASSKASVVTMADLSSLQVEADVSETNVAKVSQGQPCEIVLDSLPDVRYVGTVHMIVPTADRSKASVLVKVRFRHLDPRVLPEMSARVAFLSRPPAAEDLQPVVTLPAKAVTGSGTDRTVYLVREGKGVRTSVKVGRQLGDQLEILAGAVPGDKAILSPPPRLRDGSPVRVKDGQP